MPQESRYIFYYFPGPPLKEYKISTNIRFLFYFTYFVIFYFKCNNYYPFRRETEFRRTKKATAGEAGTQGLTFPSFQGGVARIECICFNLRYFRARVVDFASTGTLPELVIKYLFGLGSKVIMILLSRLFFQKNLHITNFYLNL